MSQYLSQFRMLKDADRKRVIAAAHWGDGPFTRMVIKQFFPAIETEEIPSLIKYCCALAV
jgi:hypothetical protein